MIKTPPPRRNYAQMVRVIRDEPSGQFTSNVPYQLGKAYGSEASSGTDTRIRSLDEIGINTRPVNQLQAPNNNSYYSNRESTTLYHQLTSDQQQYFDGVNPNPAPTRLDARPGTKTRAYLGSNAPSEHINVAAQQRSNSANTGTSPANESMKINDDEHAKKSHSALHTRSTTRDTHIPNHSTAPKQTRLPFVERATLEGIANTTVDFSLDL